MSVKERQRQIIERIIQTAPIRLQLQYVNQLGDETPDTHRYSLGCLDCNDKWILIDLEQNKEAEWELVAGRRLQQHLDLFHKR